MAKRCLKCWSRVTDGAATIADDFDGFFCRDCYIENRDSVDGLLGLISLFLDEKDGEERQKLFEETEAYAVEMDLDENGADLLFSWMNDRLPQVTGIVEEEQEEEDIADAERTIRARERRIEYTENRRRLRREFIAVTSNRIEGYRITAYHGIVTGTSVLGTGLFSEVAAQFADFSGTESRSFSNKVEIAKNSAMEYAIENAILAGGNAMIAVDIDVTMFRNNMIGTIVNGTAVTVEKEGET